MKDPSTSVARYILATVAIALVGKPFAIDAFHTLTVAPHSRTRVASKTLQTPLRASTPARVAFESAEREASILDWSFLDGVYLITCPNADPEGERIEKAQRFLDGAGLLDRVQIKEFDTDDENRIRGCYTSHISVMRDIIAECSSKKSNQPFSFDLLQFFDQNDRQTSQSIKDDDSDDVMVLVLEDNLFMRSSSVQQSTIDRIKSFCRNTPDWDMILLSYIPYVPNLKVSKTRDDGIVKLSCGVGSALGTTAYIINGKAMKSLLQDDKDKGGFYAPIPDVMAEVFPESRYAVNPTMFLRAPNTKSLVNPQLDDLRSLLFQPPVTAAVQSLLATTGLSTNTLLPIVIVSLLIVSIANVYVAFDAFSALWTTGSVDGPIIFPIISAIISLLSLAIIAKGAMLAPKPEESK